MRPRLRGGILNDVSFVAKRVFPALAVFFFITAATTVLGIVSTMLGTSPGLLPISVNIVLSWALWVLLFTTRHELTQSKWSILEAVVAFVIWLLVFTSTATQLLI